MKTLLIAGSNSSSSINKQKITHSEVANLFFSNFEIELDNIIILGCTLWSYLSQKDFVSGMKILSESSFVKHSNTIFNPVQDDIYKTPVKRRKATKGARI